jgi:DNA-binding NtrC family response regulator
MKRILVVDDQLLILYSLSRLLEDNGVEVTTVSNGSDAIKACQHCFYNLCLLDIRLPDIDGIDVMMEIRKLSPETKIVVMSSLCVSDTVRENIDNNAYFFIPKPFELPYLKAIVRSAMKGDKAIHYSDACRKDNVSEQRRSERSAVSREITYTINWLDKIDSPELEAKVVNISDFGMCIVTDYPVNPGCVIRFHIMQDGIHYRAGVVADTSVIDSELFMAGIKFI